MNQCAADGTNLSAIMHWIKTHSAKRWNCIHGSIDHLWGKRCFARIIKDLYDYFSVFEYIDRNPVKSGLALFPSEWRPSGAYHIAHDNNGLVDYTPFERQRYVKYLPAPKKVPGTVFTWTITLASACEEDGLKELHCTEDGELLETFLRVLRGFSYSLTPLLPYSPTPLINENTIDTSIGTAAANKHKYPMVVLWP